MEAQSFENDRENSERIASSDGRNKPHYRDESSGSVGGALGHAKPFVKVARGVKYRLGDNVSLGDVLSEKTEPSPRASSTSTRGIVI